MLSVVREHTRHLFFVQRAPSARVRLFVLFLRFRTHFAMSSTRLSLATALVVALAGTPRGVCFVGVGCAARTSCEASSRRHAAAARATERPTRRGAMQTDAEEEIRAASLANVRNVLRLA